MSAARPVYASAIGRPVFLCVVLACVCAWLLRIFAGLGVSIAGLAPPTWLLFVLCALLFFLIGLGSFYPPSGIFGRPLLSGPADRPLFALTFDDGPDPGGTRAVLAVLARHGVRATFFIIGERAARHPELVAELAAAGHQIENHSLRHSWATPFLSRFRLAAELKKTQEIVTSASGGARAPRWFRPPIGILSPPVASAARRVGLRLCGWSCKSRDGLSFTGADAALARLKKGLRPGAILLLHDAAERGGHTPVAATVLEALLPIAKERGLRPVTLDELVR